MSNRELCVKLLENVPDYKIGYVLAYIQGLTADEDADDAFCEKLVDEYENDPEKDVSYTLEDCKKEWGLS
ncbi:hypothetical protein [Hominenteromicrobium sp.]|jgi:hypothetical protein|uniref:hypothetical protein n=1 Tax=Hominenteromicrobium sp. TaxID=3073581 RepID=UPI003A8DDDB9